MPNVDLATLSFFEGFDESSLAKVAKLGEEIVVEAGAMIVDQGEVGQEAFVVEEGEVEIIVGGHPVAKAGPGTVLGEMALLEHRPRSARILAVTETRLMSFNSKGFRKILDEMPEESRRALAETNQRFRAQNEEITQGDRPPRITG